MRLSSQTANACCSNACVLLLLPLQQRSKTLLCEGNIVACLLHCQRTWKTVGLQKVQQHNKLPCTWLLLKPHTLLLPCNRVSGTLTTACNSCTEHRAQAGCYQLDGDWRLFPRALPEVPYLAQRCCLYIVILIVALSSARSVCCNRECKQTHVVCPA